MAFKKGQPRHKNAGRKKGTPNKSTAAIKGQWLQVFDMIGGVEALAKWAVKNRTMFYRLTAGMLPREITGSDGGDIGHTVRVIVEDDLNFFGPAAQITTAASNGAPAPGADEPSEIQGGGVRASVGQNGTGPHCHS